MSVNRYIQQSNIRAAESRKVLAELQQLATTVERCQQTSTAVNTELGAANAKYQGERTTQQEVEYLTILLDCAKKKLAWEKQISSLQKRAPELLQRMSKALNDPDHPPADAVKAEMFRALQIVQGALEKLQAQ